MWRLSGFKGLSSKIYIAFLVTAAVPVLVAGLVGIYFSLDALRKETLHHLEQEVTSRAEGMARFFDQLTSELLYLASSSLLSDVADNMSNGSRPLPRETRQRLERDYAAFARAYPYIYQVRFVDAGGHEVVRVDRRDGRLHTVPEGELQDKSDRYYVHEGMAHEPGQVYVSPLDLNIEHGQVEAPERPVIRFATPIADRKGVKRGLLIINLHAAFLLGQIQEMAAGRGGVAYLFDRSGFYLSRSSDAAEPEFFKMQSVEALTALMSRQLLTRIINREKGTELLGESIIAHAPIGIGQTLSERSDSSMDWAVALSFPRKRLFEAVFNLYLLYGVLTLTLIGTAVAGFLLSRHLLRPLEQLSAETEEIARGNFSRRVEIRGADEIADLGTRFNSMATRLEQSYRALEDRKGELEKEVQIRTAALEREQQERRELDRQMFQVEKMTTMGEIAMGLAHEIGNPLAGMKAVTQMLLEEDLTEHQLEYLGRTLNEVNRLSDFLRTFHGFAAPQDFHPVACRLEQVLEDVLLWTRKEAKSRGVTIDFSLCSASVPALWADPNRLKQVLLNLVINAIHAMPEGGRIEIGMCAGLGHPEDLDGDVPKMRFCVRDTGVGIPPEVLPKVFDPFYTTRADGSGLGLAVVKKIALQHGADIRVESKPGQGTCFELIWPIAPGEDIESLRRLSGAEACRELAQNA
ncbi:MAG: HAMP domain-containing protein [Betaproteobacteria bacterium]|nr:HAMP domain-containing protein [Betaproteobacteria bacterium]